MPKEPTEPKADAGPEDIAIREEDLPAWAKAVEPPPGATQVEVLNAALLLPLASDLEEQWGPVYRNVGMFLRALVDIGKQAAGSTGDFTLCAKELVYLHPGYLMASNAATQWVRDALVEEVTESARRSGTKPEPGAPVGTVPANFYAAAHDLALRRRPPWKRRRGRSNSSWLDWWTFEWLRPAVKSDGDAYARMLAAAAAKGEVKTKGAYQKVVGRRREAGAYEAWAQDKSICKCGEARTVPVGGQDVDYLVRGVPHRHCVACQVAAPLMSPMVVDLGDGRGLVCSPCRRGKTARRGGGTAIE